MKNRKVLKKILSLLIIFTFAPGVYGASGGEGEAAKTEEKKTENTPAEPKKKEPGEWEKIVPVDPPIGVPLSRDIHEKIDKLTRAQRPEVYRGKMILTYMPMDMNYRQKPRAVSAVFDHESYTRSHIFKINRNGVYFLAEDVPSNLNDPIRYRLVVDGLWMTDPQNSQSTSIGGQRVSVLEIGSVSSSHGYPILKEGGRVEFFIDAASLKNKSHLLGNVSLQPGQRVYLTGSFSRWDPYLYEMKPVNSHGTTGYGLSLILPPGQHYYRFVIGTKEVPDPNNNHKIVYDENNQPMSVFINEKNYKSTLAPVNWGVDKDEEKSIAVSSGSSGKGSSTH